MRKNNIGSGDVVVPDAPNNYKAGINMNINHLVYDTSYLSCVCDSLTLASVDWSVVVLVYVSDAV